ncbi:MAG: hypothetical protein Q4A05_07425 [Ruminococcus sp.]|nr:hypothetical protein [Ruminococcus sp.]
MKERFPSRLNTAYAVSLLPVGAALLVGLYYAVFGYRTLSTIFFGSGKEYGFEAFIDVMLTLIFCMCFIWEWIAAAIGIVVLSLIYIAKRISFRIRGELRMSDTAMTLFTAAAAGVNVLVVIGLVRLFFS